MFFKEGKQNTFIFFKNEWKEGKPTELLVKRRKSYHVWPLSDACLKRGEWDLVPGPHFFLSTRCSWREEGGAGKETALKGEFCHSTLCAPSFSPHLSPPWGPRSMDSEEASAVPVTQEPEASGRLLGWRAEHRYFWDSTWRRKPRGAWKRVWRAGACGQHWTDSAWIGRWDSRSNYGQIVAVVF